MAVVGELEGLISNHNLLITRGQITEAAKIRDLIAGYISQKEMMPRFYKTIRGKFEEFIFCAETNFSRFREIINYKQLTQLEYYYPEYFKELSRELNLSAEKMLQAGSEMYSGLLAASSIYTSRDILVRVVQALLQNKNYMDLERVFDRLDETRKMKMSFNPQGGIIRDLSMLPDLELAQQIGRMIMEAYTGLTKGLEIQNIDLNVAKNAYRLANILTMFLPELNLLPDSSMVSTATLCFKELARSLDVDQTQELVQFLEKFKRNPAIQRFAKDNPSMFENYLNGPDLRDVLGNMVRDLLGKTRFEEVKSLTDGLDGIISFSSVFKDHLITLKGSGFFVQAIEMAEKLQLKEEITEDLKLEAFRKLVEDLVKNPVKASIQRLKKFSLKFGVNADSFPQILEEVSNTLDNLERSQPELATELARLYQALRIEKKEAESRGGGLDFGKIFEPIIWLFVMFFKLCMRLLSSVITREPVAGGAAGKGVKAAVKGRTG